MRLGIVWAIVLVLSADFYLAIAILAALSSLHTERLREACPMMAVTILSTVWFVLRRREVSVGVLVPCLTLFLFGLAGVLLGALVPSRGFALTEGAMLSAVAVVVYWAARLIVRRWLGDPRWVGLWGLVGVVSSLAYFLFWCRRGLEGIAYFVAASCILLLPAVRNRLVGSAVAVRVEEKR